MLGISNLNLDNREYIDISTLEKILDMHESSNEKQEDLESYNKLFYQNSLLKLFIFSSHKDCLYLNALVFNEQDDSLTQVNLGKINLIRNYFRNSLSNLNVTYAEIINIKTHFEYTRYEFLFISKTLRLLIVGNRQGDIQIYEMELKLYKDGKIGIKEEPLMIFDCNNRIVGMTVIEHINHVESFNSYIDIYIMKINRKFENLRVRLKF